MFTEAEAPDTSVPVVALTSFTVWGRALFGTQIRPKAETESAVEPTVSFVPTQPLKSLRNDCPLTAYPVTKLVPVEVVHWKFAVTVCADDIITVSGLLLLCVPVQ